MRFVTCGNCRNEKSLLHLSLQIDDVIYCEDCLKEKFSTDDSLKGKKIVKEFDPTICFSCSKDFDDLILNRLGEYPVCKTCEQEIKIKTFPLWVKGFFAGVLMLVVFSLVWNWRFIRAYSLVKNADQVMKTGTLEEAADLFRDISINLPEVEYFASLSEYYRGILLLNKDEGAEAYLAFQNCTNLPDSYFVATYMLQAEIGASFDRKDYRGFVHAAKKYLSHDTSAIAMAQVASAYACIYADQKADSAKTLATDYLAKALAVNDTTRFFTTYINMIEYRLATGDIIDREKFEAKFPNGWTNN